jgi:hypothetical protein
VAFADLSDAQRFMRQASFAEFPGEAQAIITSGDTAGEVFDAWYDSAFAYGPAAAPVVAENAAAGDNISLRIISATMQLRALSLRAGGSVFRNKMVVAWQKLLAIGFPANATDSRMHESLHNSLLNLLDGTLLDYLRWLAYDKWPGFFLDNLDNKGRDPATSFFDIEPNQNFVREKLQLFTLGEYELNKDGTYKLDGNGERIPTYVYEDVLNMARLYSGMALSGNNHAMVVIDSRHYRGAVNMPTAGITRAAYDPTVPTYPPLGTKFTLGENIYGKIEEVCQWIYNHDAFLVYFAKMFIHELVNENPTPQYVRRVVAALENDGTGVRGSIRAMLRAILLDPEARGSVSSKDANTYGRALDMHLATAAVYRAGEQYELAEYNYTINCDLVNGSTTVTGSTADIKRLEGYNGNWRVTGGSLPGGATVFHSTPTTVTLNAAYAGTTGTYALTFQRPSNAPLFNWVDDSSLIDGTAAANNAAGRSPAFWGVPATVFADYPYDYEGAPGFLARAASLWSASGVLSMWQTLIRAGVYHSKNGTYASQVARRAGAWDLTYMTSGSPTNAQLVDRAEAIILHGRTLPAPAKAKLVEMLDQMMTDSAAHYGVTDSAMKLDRRAAHILGAMQFMPQAMEQI